MPRLSRRFLLLAAAGLTLSLGVSLALTSRGAEADVSAVIASAPMFGPGQPLTIEVRAEDDDGTLLIRSSLTGSTLSVTGCSGIGTNQVPGRCDISGISAVTGQGTANISINTATLDSDEASEPLIVTLTLTAACVTTTGVTVSADQPGNVGPDDVTVNCVPPTATPTLTPTPTSTPTPPPTSTPVPPTATPVPPTPVPSIPVAQVLSSVIQPPNTGDAGLR